MAKRRIRVTPQTKTVPGWKMDFDHGEKYRFIRPDAAAEVVSMENEKRRTFMRQPDAYELEDMRGNKPLREPGEWIIRRAEVPIQSFGM